MEETIFLWVALILLSTKVAALIFKRIHMPQVVGALVAGILLGPAVFGWLQPNETIRMLAQFGVVLLLFSAGMETDLKELRSSIKASSIISLAGMLAVLGGGFLVSYIFGMSAFEAFFISLAIASTSTSILVESLQEMGKLKTKTGTVMVNASLIDDIITIVLLAVVMGMGETSEISIGGIFIVLLQIIAFFAFAFAMGFLVNKLFNWLYSRMGANWRYSIFAIVYCFLMAFLAEQFGLADITGAYIAGIAFCTTRCVESLEADTHTMSYMFFTPLFLANIGLSMTFAGMTGEIIIFTVALVIVAIVSKAIGCGFGAKLAKYTNRESMQIGMGMTARGEVSFIVINKGIILGYIGSLIFPSIIIVVLVAILVTTILLKPLYTYKSKDATA
ncbi:MAG: cation:proton antiporter [Defluviitaleaceae bacterium]|nr:cation:proton antiporter [Defluviitaleaceae bacterium]